MESTALESEDLAHNPDLQSFSNEILQNIFEKLNGASLAALGSTNRYFRGLVFSDDAIWKNLLSSDFGIDQNHFHFGPRNHKQYREIYAEYYSICKIYGTDAFRAIKAWSVIRSWLFHNAPAIYDTLNDGVSEEELDAAARTLGIRQLPSQFRAVYRIHNGQIRENQETTTANNTNNQIHASDFLGLFGGTSFYSHTVSVKMLPLNIVVRYTNMIFGANDRLIIGTSFNTAKILYYDLEFITPCIGGQNFLTTIPLVNLEGFDRNTPSLAWAMKQAAALGLLRNTSGSTSTAIARMSNPNRGRGNDDLFLHWFESYAHQLQQGNFTVRALTDEQKSSIGVTGDAIGISLFPRNFPQRIEMITDGLRVRASFLFVPEMAAQLEQAMFAYDIEFYLLSVEEQQQLAVHYQNNRNNNGGDSGSSSGGSGNQANDMPSTSNNTTNNNNNNTTMNVSITESNLTTPFLSVQLLNRHWIVKNEGGTVVDEITGEGVVGQHPLLTAGGEPYSYQSCTYHPFQSLPRYFGGSFTFIEGSLKDPGSRRIKAECPLYMFDIPKISY